MRGFKLLALAAVAALCFAAIPAAQAQVSFGINLGPEPVCPYGYFDYAPYNCAPYGYYGPEWFDGGVFIGTGRWYRGHDHFYGHVDRHFDPRYGYHGHFPARGEHAVPHNEGFHGGYLSDGHGHYHRDDHHR